MSVERDRIANGSIARWREHSRRRSRKFTLKGEAEAWEREMDAEHSSVAFRDIPLPGFEPGFPP